MFCLFVLRPLLKGGDLTAMGGHYTSYNGLIFFCKIGAWTKRKEDIGYKLFKFNELQLQARRAAARRAQAKEQEEERAAARAAAIARAEAREVAEARAAKKIPKKAAPPKTPTKRAGCDIRRSVTPSKVAKTSGEKSKVIFVFG